MSTPMQVLTKEGVQALVGLIKAEDASVLGAAKEHTNNTLLDVTLEGRFLFGVDFASGELIYTIVGDAPYEFAINVASGQLEYVREE